MEEINSTMFNDDSTSECRNASQMQIGEKPFLGMKFNSHVEAYDYYNSYALMMGFGIRKSSVNYSQKDKEVLNRKFVCDKEGYRSNKDKRDIGKNINHRRETRVGCKAMMRIKLMEDKTWKVIGFIEDHTNHMLSSPDKAKMHRSQQQFHRSKRFKKIIQCLQEEGITPSTISRVISITSGREDESVTPQQCIDYMKTQRHNNIMNKKKHLFGYFRNGMRSTQRSESINSFFDGYVNSQTQLKEFVTQYEKAVTHRRLSEAHEDFRTLNTKPQFHLGHPIERQAGSSYTRTMFHVFQNEIKGCGVLGLQEVTKEEKSALWRVGNLDESNEKWRFVTYDECRELQYSCSCGMFENSGVLCKHILYTLMFNRQCCSLPSVYIIHRWTIDARHRNIGVTNVVFGKNITGGVEKINLLKTWALKAKTNNALELAFESDKRMHELDSLLTSFIERVEEEVRGCQAIDAGSSHIPDSDIPQIPTSDTIQHIPQITVRDPEKQARTKGRPRNATRIKSTLEQAQEKKERQKRTCSRCGQLGHYRTSCTVNKPSETDKQD
ncbi:protein FAR1-RELATED SEQUENCE 5-like [Asparagus officinalis]|uniref:protein FAR1-RELATED SEQUENCE 5-like n=1 Tax=Asparagus officinalis TaxID=4686 RepID=UPI00098E36AB|nr:protein FAR1-RELATED SEQUENCE 5-like [Asparagus officinalis]